MRGAPLRLGPPLPPHPPETSPGKFVTKESSFSPISIKILENSFPQGKKKNTGFPAQSLGLGPANTPHFQEHHAEVTPIAFRRSSSGRRTQLAPLQVCARKVRHTVVSRLGCPHSHSRRPDARTQWQPPAGRVHPATALVLSTRRGGSGPGRASLRLRSTPPADPPSAACTPPRAPSALTVSEPRPARATVPIGTQTFPLQGALLVCAF